MPITRRLRVRILVGMSVHSRAITLAPTQQSLVACTLVHIRVLTTRHSLEAIREGMLARLQVVTLERIRQFSVAYILAPTQAHIIRHSLEAIQAAT